MTGHKQGLVKTMKVGRRKGKPFLFKKMTWKKKLTSLLWQSGMTKSINKMFMTLIYIRNSTFLSLKIMVYTD